MKKKKALNDIPAILFSLYIVLSSYSVYMVLFPIGSYVQMFTIGLCAVIFLYYYAVHPINVRVLIEPVAVVAVLLIVSFLNGSDVRATFLLGLRLVLIYYAVSVFILKGYDMMYSLYRAVFFLGVVFLIFYLVFDFLMPQAGLSHFYTYSTDVYGIEKSHSYLGHFNIYFRWETTNDLFGFSFPRCSGFCWEPGQYQIYLNFALFYLVYFNKGEEAHSKRKIVIILVAILSTASTMGIIIAIILMAGVMLKIRLKIIKYPLLMAMTILVIVLVNQLLIEKQEVSSISYTARTSEFELLQDIFFKNSFLGTPVRTQNMANAIFRFMWQFGYVSVGIIALSVYYIFTDNALLKKKRQKFFFLIWMVLSLVNEPIEYMNSTFMLLSMISLGVVLKSSMTLKNKNVPAVSSVLPDNQQS